MGLDAAPMADAGHDAGRREPGRSDAGDGGADDDAGGCTGGGCDIVQLAAGLAHSCALRANGEVLCWGQNVFGELGDARRAHDRPDCTPLGDAERVHCSATPVRVALPDGAAATAIVARGGLSSCALLDSGALHCWGLGALPEMGSEERERRFAPVEIAAYHGAVEVSDNGDFSCALLADGTVACAGQNEDGQLGIGGTMEQITARPVPGLTAMVEVEVSGFFGSFSCARSATQVSCWGENSIGQLGDGRTDHGTCGDRLTPYDCADAPVAVPALTGVPLTDLALGPASACAVETSGTVRCWGLNDVGQLALDPAASDVLRTPTEVPALLGAEELALGASHGCALFAGGVVRCWGANDEGQLGDGSLDHPGQCLRNGRELIDCASTPVDVELPGPATTVASGVLHSCAVVAGSEVWCWGWNDRRQLGEPSRERQPAPIRVTGLRAG
jgi:alpha-tubulin suppressor-like RCC1 family protein